MYVLGLDAGNSKTVALVADSKGNILGFGRSGCGDISNRDIGVEQALANVISVVRQSLEDAAISAEDISARAFSMAGADWSGDFDFLKAELSQYVWGENTLIVNDALGALRSASVDGLGVAVVCGTYAVTAARASNSKNWHASFWQETGGAYKLGREALKVIYRSHLEIDRSTSLTKAVLDYLEMPDVEAVLHSMTARGANVLETDIAKLAPLVLTEAERGDGTARRIVNDQAVILADYVLVAARKVELADSFKLFLTGGVFRHSSNLLETTLKARVLETYPNVQVVKSQTEPVLGSLLYGFEQANIPITETLYEHLQNNLPDRALFAT